MKHVVIVGGGFGGLTLARSLRRVPVRVTLIDRENHHLFQPLLYQVATASLSPGDIATPIRSVLRKQPTAVVLQAEVTAVDLQNRCIRLEDGQTLSYDYLALAAGTETNYYGHDDWSAHAMGLKSIRDAIEMRERILSTFEAAEREEAEQRRKRMLTFVVIGGGPTGVELAGAISELSRNTLRRDFRLVQPGGIRVLLVEMADRVLTAFDERLSASARAQLEELNVEVRTETHVTHVDKEGVYLDGEFIPASVVCWATGVRPVPLTERLGLPTRRGAVIVQQDCSIPDHPEVFVIGDMASFVPEGEERPLPGLAPVAMQQARYVAHVIQHAVQGSRIRKPFRYRDKGIMATVGRSRAVAQSGALRLTGFIAWLAWLIVHLLYLIGFRNRFVVLFNWFWSYVTFKRGARLIVRREKPLSPSSGR